MKGSGNNEEQTEGKTEKCADYQSFGFMVYPA